MLQKLWNKLFISADLTFPTTLRCVTRGDFYFERKWCEMLSKAINYWKKETFSVLFKQNKQTKTICIIVVTRTSISSFSEGWSQTLFPAGSLSGRTRPERFCTIVQVADSGSRTPENGSLWFRRSKNWNQRAVSGFWWNPEQARSQELVLHEVGSETGLSDPPPGSHDHQVTQECNL